MVLHAYIEDPQLLVDALEACTSDCFCLSGEAAEEQSEQHDADEQACVVTEGCARPAFTNEGS